MVAKSWDTLPTVYGPFPEAMQTRADVSRLKVGTFMSSNLLSKQGFVLRTGVSLSSLNRHLKDGRIRYCRLGSRVLIPESEIQRLADLAAPGGCDVPVIAEPLTAERSEV